MTYAKATGRLVMNPKRKDDRPEMAAVAVIRSRLISDVQVSKVHWCSAKYAVRLTQQTEVVLIVIETDRIHGIIAHACASGVCKNRCIDRDNVCPGNHYQYLLRAMLVGEEQTL
jgi:DNA-binding protein